MAPTLPGNKKSNPLLWIGIGCGALLVLSLVGGALAYYFTMRAAKSAFEGIASSVAPSGAAPGAACGLAVECCRKVNQKTGAGAQADSACQGLAALSEAQCQLSLTAYQRSAELLGLKCP